MAKQLPKLKSDWQAAAKTLGLPITGTKAEIASRVTRFGYNATVDKGRRQAPQTKVRHESLVLPPKKRSKLQATAQDLPRNHSLAAWMVRLHLDYVSRFHISFRTGNEALDKAVNKLFRWHGKPKNFDVAGRFGRDEFMRLFELEKSLSGDAGMIKSEGVKLQAVESDLIAKGQNAPGGSEINDSGLVVNSVGGVELYAICNRGKDGQQVIHDHLEPAENVIFDGYFTRFSSQFRGVSPLSTAINSIQDIAEGCEFNQIKAKMHALFGVAILRDAGMDGEYGGAAGATAETDGATHQADGSDKDLNPRTVNMIDLLPGEDIKTIESGTPSNEFVQGTYLFIQLAMLAFDIPITFFDSRRSSFSARIADLNLYEVSAESKRTKNRYNFQEYSDWVLESFWNDTRFGIAAAAEEAGLDLLDVQESLDWIPAGSPWLDKLKQIMGDKMAIEIGLDNPIDAARRRGGNVFKNIDKIKEVQDYAKLKGVPLTIGSSTGVTLADVAAIEDDDDEPDEGSINE